MKSSKALPAIFRIAKYTLMDELRHKSFIIMFVFCALCVFLVRGCYQGNYMVNGHYLDAETVVRAVSKVAFHIIAAGAMVLAALLSMRIFRRDGSDGMLSCVLSKPITRWQYVSGKIIGLWGLSVVFMFALHCIVFLIAFIDSNVFMPGYITASLICSVNLLFVILASLLLSLTMSDIIAFLYVLGVGVADFVTEGIATASHSQIAQVMLGQPGAHSQPPLTWWKIVYCLWPKLLGVQQWAISLTGGTSFHGFTQTYPLINIGLYCIVLCALLILRFGNKDI
jgi:ABC-type transport system involved in multi-copper enzyme maturation permease subunit